MRRLMLVTLLLAAVCPCVSAQPVTRDLRVLVDSINAASLAGQHARALAFVEAALAGEPGNLILLDALIRTHGRRKDSVQVLRALERVLPVGGTRPVIGDSIFAFMATNPRFVELGGRIARTHQVVEARDTAGILPPGERLGEGLAVDASGPSAVTLFSGGRPRGGISLLRLGAEDSTRLLVETGGGAVYGMTVDRKGQLWANVSYPGANGPSRSTLVVVDPGTGSIVRRFHSPADGESHLFNDVAVTADGTAFVTDSDAKRIYVVRDTGQMAERPVEVFFAGAPDFTVPNGITLSADDSRLYVAHMGGVDQWQVATRMRRRVATTREWPLEGFDGLYACGAGLIGVQALPGVYRVVSVALDASGTRAVRYQVHHQVPRAGHRLSTGAIRGNTFFYHTGRDADPAGGRRGRCG
jgi:hypothetical protein